MTETLAAWNAWLNGYVWGLPMIVLLMGTGLLLTIITGGAQFRYLRFALVEVLGKLTTRGAGQGNVSPFQAVSTALASTVGVGNIAGVATAISIGGPGALFWLWVSGVLGMVTKFAEIVVAIHYREPDAKGIMRGGAMYILNKGLGLPWLGTLFALLTSIAAFGIGNMVQANSVADSLRATFGIAPAVTGMVLVVVTAVVILGGITRIGEVTQYMVPFMAILYLGGGFVILAMHAGQIPHALGLVIDGAFSGTAAAGGFAGSTMAMALRYGVARGLFSNEAGLGSAPMVHAVAETDHPVRQGMYGIFEVFVDTILICTTTGLVILVTGTWDSGATGAALSARAFEVGLPGAWGASSSRRRAAVLVFDAHWLELLRRDRDRLPLRHAGGDAVPDALAGLRVSRVGRIAAPGVGHRRHAQRHDGHPEPRGRARVDRPAAAPGARVLCRSALRSARLTPCRGASPGACCAASCPVISPRSRPTAATRDWRVFRAGRRRQTRRRWRSSPGCRRQRSSFRARGSRSRSPVTPTTRWPATSASACRTMAATSRSGSP
jgi:AGCS family alanine or glycine:cation symporter